MDALRCPPPDSPVTNLSGGERRRVALCKLLLQKPDLLLLDEPTNHLDAESVLWLEQHLEGYPGAVIAVTHDRYFLDNVAAVDRRGRPRSPLPVRGQLLDLPREEVRATDDPGQEGRQAGQAAQDRARVGPQQRQGSSGQEQGATGPLRGDGGRGRAHPQARLRGAPDPAGPAPRLDGHRGQEPQEGLRRPGPHRQPVVLPAAQRHRRRHRPQRRRQVDPLQDDRRLRGARRRRGQDRRDRQDLLRRPGP